MTPVEILRKAAEVVQVRGLARGMLWDGEEATGPVCLRGAIGVADCGHPWGRSDGPTVTMDIASNDAFKWSNSEAEGPDDVASLLLSEAEACE